MAQQAARKATRKATKKKATNKPGRSGATVLAPSDVKLVSAAVRYINRRAQGAVDGASAALLDIGAYCLAKFFDDDPAKVPTRTGGRRKQTDFTALADHPELELSRTHLYNAVSVAIQERVLTAAGVSDLNRIRPTHKIMLLAARAPGDTAAEAEARTVALKQRLIAEIVAERLSVRALQARIADIAGKQLPAAGGKPDPLDPDFLRRLRSPGFPLPAPLRKVAQFDADALITGDLVAALERDQVAFYRATIEVSIDRLRQMLRRLRELTPAAGGATT